MTSIVHVATTANSFPVPSDGKAARICAPRLFSPAPNMPTDRLRGWIVTLGLSTLALIIFIIGVAEITDNGTPIFDEKHYVPQAYQILSNGHWVEDNPGYALVVHPPIGKWCIALGMWLFGYVPLGWRFASVIAGTLLVFFIIRITRRLSRSTLIGGIAGILALTDGVIFVASRTGLLDIFLITFVMGALSALLADRDQILDRLEHWRAREPDAPLLSRNLGFGPRLGIRPWRILAGIQLGLATGCKWSGVYFIIAFFVTSFISDATARKRVGIYQPWVGAIIKDLLWGVLTLIVLPVVVYMGSWVFWFANETSYDRFVDLSHKTGWAFTSKFSPLHYSQALSAWWYYQIDEVLHFHTTLTTQSVNKPHPWESKPWSWPMSLRPVLYFYHESGSCNACYGKILQVGTPSTWWLAFPMLAVAMWRSLVRRRWSYTIMLMGYLTAWLPWFGNIDRQMYFFYAITMAPFLLIGISLIIGDFIGASAPILKNTILIAQVRWIFAASYLAVTVIIFLWLLPIFTGMPMTIHDIELRTWLPSWG